MLSGNYGNYRVTFMAEVTVPGKQGKHLAVAQFKALNPLKRLVDRTTYHVMLWTGTEYILLDTANHKNDAMHALNSLYRLWRQS